MYTFEQQNDYVDNKGTNSNFYESVIEIANNHNHATYKNYGHKVRAFARYAPDTTATVSLDVNVEFRRNISDNHGSSSRQRDEGTNVQESENSSNRSSGDRNLRYGFYAEKKLTTSKILLSFRQNTSFQQSENTNSRNTFDRSEEHTSELQSLMRISYAVFCLKKKKTNQQK